jgi:hypothetical protein
MKLIVAMAAVAVTAVYGTLIPEMHVEGAVRATRIPVD